MKIHATITQIIQNAAGTPTPIPIFASSERLDDEEALLVLEVVGVLVMLARVEVLLVENVVVTVAVEIDCEADVEEGVVTKSGYQPQARLELHDST